MTKLKNAQRRLIPALRPEIEKGDITIDLTNERLLINLRGSGGRHRIHRSVVHHQRVGKMYASLAMVRVCSGVSACWASAGVAIVTTA